MLEYLPQIQQDMEYGTFREVKGLVWNRMDGGKS